MGFTHQQAVSSLRSTNQDLEAAVLLLLANPSGEISGGTGTGSSSSSSSSHHQGSPQPPPSTTTATNSNGTTSQYEEDDPDLSAAIQASLQTSKKENGHRQKSNAKAYPIPPPNYRCS